MESHSTSFLPLLIIILLAFCVPLVLARLKRLPLPIAVGEIIAGIIIGKSGFGLVEDSAVLKMLSDLGFVYLMFLSGLEIDIAGMISTGDGRKGPRWVQVIRSRLFVGLAFFLLTLILALGFAAMLQQFGVIDNLWFMGFILATTSLGVVAPVLKEKALMGEDYGQLILVAAMIADFASILMISVFVLLKSRGPSFEIFFILLLILIFVLVYRLAGLFQKHLPAEKFFDEVSSATSQIELRGSLALAFVFIVLANSLGVENILGAFLAGMVIALLTGGERSVLRQKLDAVGYGFFIPVFFIMIGVHFDLPALIHSEKALHVTLLLVVGAYLVKMVPALIFRLRHGWRESFAAGALLSSRLSLIIAAAMIGADLGLVSAMVNNAILLVAIITCTLSPLLFNWWVSNMPLPKERVLIIGCRNYAEILWRRLSARGMDVTLVCMDDSREHRSAVRAPAGVRFQAGISAEMRKAGIESAKTVVALGDNDSENFRICRVARHLFNIEHVVAWVQNPVFNSSFRRLGVRLINPAFSAVLMMEGLVLNPEFFKHIGGFDATFDFREIKLKNESFNGRSVKDVDLPADVIVLMIERRGDYIVPEQETRLRLNDRIFLTGPMEKIDAVLAEFV